MKHLMEIHDEKDDNYSSDVEGYIEYIKVNDSEVIITEYSLESRNEHFLPEMFIENTIFATMDKVVIDKDANIWDVKIEGAAR